MSLIVINGVLLHSGIPQVIILILALSYFTAGLYQDRPLMWMGVLLGISYVLVTLVSGPVWTIVGVVIAGSLVAIVYGLTGLFIRVVFLPPAIQSAVP